MQRSNIIILVVALLFILSVVNTQAKVSLSFEQPLDKFLDGAPVQLRIQTTQDENINGMTFLPKLTTEEAGQSTQAKLMQFSPSGSYVITQLFGVTDLSSYLTTICIDSTTGQKSGNLEYGTDGSFTYYPNGAATFSQIYNEKGKYGTFNVLCATYLKTFTGSVSKNIHVTWKDGSDTKTNDVTLEPPTQFLKAIDMLNLETPKLKKGNKNTGTVSFSFTSTSIGSFVLSFTQSLYVTKNDDKAKMFCTSDGNNEAARISYGSSTAMLYIPKLVDTTINCEIQVTFNTWATSDSNRVGLRLSMGGLASTTYFDFKTTVREPFAFGSLTNVQTTLTVPYYQFGIYASLSAGSKIPLTNSSNVVMEFSSEIDLSKFSSELTKCEIGTLKVDGQTLTLNDIKVPLNLDNMYEIQCQVYITDKFDYTKFKDATFTLTVDEKVVKSIEGGKSQIEFNNHPRPLISTRGSSEITADGNELTIKDEFQFDNLDYPVPVPNPQFLIGVVGPAPVKFEDLSSYVRCDYGNADIMDLQYDARTMSWLYKIVQINDLASFNHTIICTRKQQRNIQQGFDLTEIPDLKVSVFNYEDKTKSAPSYSVAQTSSNYKPATTTKPSDFKALDVEYQIATSGTFTIPINNDITLSEIEKYANNYKDAVSTILKDATKDDYEVSTQGSPSYSLTAGSTSISYFDVNAYPKRRKFIDSIKSEGAPGIDIGNVNIAPTSDSLFLMVAGYSQSFVGKNAKVTDVYNVPAIQEEAFETYISKTRATEPIPTNIKGGAGTSYTAITASGQWSSVVSTCGNIQFTTSANTKPDWSNWDNLELAQYHLTRCAMGAECKVSTDCAQPFGELGMVVCESSKCTFKPSQIPRIRLTNNAITVTYLFAIIAVVIALLF